jgi:hypothetical protein
MSHANTPIVLPVVEQDPYVDEYTKAHRDGQAYMLEEVKPIIDKLTAELAQRDMLLDAMRERNEATKAQLNLLLVEASGVLGTKNLVRRFHFARLANAVKATKTECLADRDAAKGRAGYMQALADVEHRIDGYYATTDEQDQKAADEYADKIRRGEA